MGWRSHWRSYNGATKNGVCPNNVGGNVSFLALSVRPYTVMQRNSSRLSRRPRESPSILRASAVCCGGGRRRSPSARCGSAKTVVEVSALYSYTQAMTHCACSVVQLFVCVHALAAMQQCTADIGYSNALVCPRALFSRTQRRRDNDSEQEVATSS